MTPYETTLKTAATGEPVSTADLKTHMRIDHSNDDTYIASLEKVAREHIEQLTSRKLITQTWYAYYHDFPENDEMCLPFGSLQSVTAVKYTDEDGDVTTWSSDEYIVQTDSTIGKIVLAWGYSWPSDSLYPSLPIEVEFVCGYCDSDADPFLVPQNIIHAIKILVAELYENRENTIVGMSKAPLRLVESLIANYRINIL
jgi:uncharacterized phiE125 gp8 family phage protein